MNPSFLKLTLVTYKNNTSLKDYLNFIEICARSGITAVQLREKNLSDNKLYELAQAIKQILNPFSIPLIINDHPKIAYEVDAQGLHLGQSDGCVLEARQKVGPNKIIGLTIDSVDQIAMANTLPIDYISIGSIFSTLHKIDVKSIWGCKKLHSVVALSKHPVIAIGGINESNAIEVMAAGVQGIAAIGAFHKSSNLIKTIQNLRNMVDR